VAWRRGLDLGLPQDRLKETPSPSRGSGGTVTWWDEEEIRLVLTILADTRSEVGPIRRELADDDGEEEEEDLG
jgi:hypothetical protein